MEREHHGTWAAIGIACLFFGAGGVITLLIAADQTAGMTHQFWWRSSMGAAILVAVVGLYVTAALFKALPLPAFREPPASGVPIDQFSPPLVSSSPQKREQSPDEHVSIAYLRRLYDDHTTAQADKIVSSYVGMEVTTAGELADVWENLEGSMSIGLTQEKFKVVVVTCKPEATERVQRLLKGARVVVRGEVAGINSTAVFLRNGDVV